VDTLDLAEHAQGELGFMTAANSARVARQRKAPITIVIGNPPYNVGQAVHNDKNQNRSYPILDQRIRETYAAESNATSVSKLSDAYVKFFRWASDRLNGRDGIVCYVTNNGFVDQLAFDGMRKGLSESFSTIYHLDLEGNVRHEPGLSGTAYNVFGIQVGVGITIAVRNHNRRLRLWYARIEKLLRREAKLSWVAARGAVSGVKWKKLIPDARHTWLRPANGIEFSAFPRLAGREERASKSGEVQVIFKDYSLGIATHRDAVVYDFNKAALAARVRKFADDYNAEVDRYKRSFKGGSLDDFVRYESIVWDRDLKADLRRGRYVEFDPDNIRSSLYRPFCRQFLYFDRILNAEVYGFPGIFPTPASQNQNRVIACSDIGFRAPALSALIAAGPADLHLCATLDGHQCFPFYTYDADGTNSRENITDWALEQYRTHYKDKKIDKWDIFHYVYGVLHHPGYRTKFADNLKRELPRIPFARDFRAFAKAGQNLAKLHLDYETMKPWKLKWIETPGEPLSYRVEKMKLNKDKTVLMVNESLALGEIPPAVYDYRLGNRSALEWVIDQYQMSEDKRSGIKSDPNREDDEEYIVRLVGQVVAVSMETVEIVNALPREFGTN
jgi:predicted helicase